MGTFRSRHAPLGWADPPPLDDQTMVIPSVDLTIVIPSREITITLPIVQRPVRDDRPLLPVRVFQSLVVSAFVLIYGLIVIGLYAIYQSLFG